MGYINVHVHVYCVYANKRLIKKIRILGFHNDDLYQKIAQNLKSFFWLAFY